MDLSTKKCVPCEGGVEPLKEKEARSMLVAATGWQIEANDGIAKRIYKKFTFKNFREVMSFLVKVGMLAEEQGHHPDIEAHYSNATLSFTTHAIGGLSENDFIMAAKVNRL